MSNSESKHKRKRPSTTAGTTKQVTTKKLKSHKVEKTPNDQEDGEKGGEQEDDGWIWEMMDCYRLIIASLVRGRTTKTPEVGDMVVETSAARYCLDRDRKTWNSRLNNSIGRLLMVKSGCMECVMGKSHDDEADCTGEERHRGQLHHFRQPLYLIETPSKKIVAWNNCTFVSVDDVDDEKEEKAKWAPLHGNTESTKWLYGPDGYVKQYDLLNKEAREYAQTAVSQALKRHGIESWTNLVELVGHKFPQLPVTESREEDEEEC